MALQKQYVIRYRYNGYTCSFAQRDSGMTSADAWFYASLHAGTVQLYGVAALNDSAHAIRVLAERCGLSDVGFRELA